MVKIFPWLRPSGPKKVVILGCGPAAMFATHAFVTSGHSVQIFSKKRPSELFGAQYLHEPIPGLGSWSTSVMVDYQLRGSLSGYRQKVYGPTSLGVRNEDLSPAKFSGMAKVWDIRAAYHDAWRQYSDLVEDVNPIDVDWVYRMRAELRPDIIFSTIPRPALCHGPHTFASGAIWALGDAPERGQYVSTTTPDNTVVCSGESEQGWYRTSKIFGYATMEWPIDRKPPIPGVAEVRKPLRHNCNCWEGSEPSGTKVEFAGRYGAWEKGYLSHHAYNRAMELAS
jgi:hypothetical protein